MIDDLNDDLSDLLGNGPREARALPAQYAAAREAAQTFTETCKKCGGRGRFISYAGNDCGPCFTCQGAGKKTFKSSPESRAQGATNRAAQPVKRWDNFKASQPEVAAWLQDNTWELAVSFKAAVEKYGELTPKQLTVCWNGIERDRVRNERRQLETRQRQAAAPTIDCSKIVTTLDKLSDPKLSRPRIRVGEVVISYAPLTSKNAGSLYVKSRTRLNELGQKVYLGKITDGKFFASRDCQPSDQAALVLAAADPFAAIQQYGRQTGSCSICSRALVDPVSIERGIGPICWEKILR